MKKQYGVDSMPETGDNVAIDFKVSREDQDAFAVRSQAKAAEAQANGRLAKEIVAVTVPQRKGDPIIVDRDEHPRATSVEALAKLKPVNKMEGATVTAGNASGVNDGAAALIIASEAAVKKYGLTPIARILGGATAGVPPRIMGFGPAPASKKLLARLGLTQQQIDVIELNEAFAARASPRSAISALPMTTRASIATAARSRLATRSACRAPASPERQLWNSRKQAGATRSPPCASASARASRLPWNGSDIRLKAPHAGAFSIQGLRKVRIS